MAKREKKARKAKALPEKPVEELSLMEACKAENKRVISGQPKPVAMQAFKLWLSLPESWLGQPESILHKLGVTDEDVVALAAFRTQRAFSEGMQVSYTVLSEWRKKMSPDDAVFDVKKMLAGKMRNVIAAVYREALVHGDAERGKFLAKYVEGWEEKMGIKHSGAVGEYQLSMEERQELDNLIKKNLE